MKARAHRVAPAVALVVACAAIWQPATSSAAPPTTVTIAPAVPGVGNCFPFGGGGGASDWTPFHAFFYRDIPAFALKPGDLLAFDLGALNDSDIQLGIEMARTTTNGGTEDAQPFQTVVNNTQTPLNPRGDTTVGNFELQFQVEAPFSFPGGGLIIRFSNPSASYQADTTCDQVLVGADATDASGFFVQRALNDADGVSPWGNPSDGSIGGFRLIIDNPSSPFGLPSNTFTFGGLSRDRQKGTALLPVTVPGPGTLSLSGDFVKTQRAGGGAAASRAVTAAGVVNLLIKSRGAKKKRLNKTGKATVRFSVTYRPTGGTQPITQTKRVKLIKNQ